MNNCMTMNYQQPVVTLMEQLYPGKGYIIIWPQNCKYDENLSMG